MIDKKPRKEPYMYMVEIQAGLGIGIKKFRQVSVYERASGVNDFVNPGWELSGQAADQGGAYAGAMSVAPGGGWLYQLTDDGRALELTGKGTKYHRDNDLNCGGSTRCDPGPGADAGRDTSTLERERPEHAIYA